MHVTGSTTPHPLRQFLLKIHSRCDLACDYCYVYTKADRRWTARPRTMSRKVIEATANRIAEHARAHHLPWVSVVLHGGEPLLAGSAAIAEIVAAVRKSAARYTEPRFSIQTNGVRLDHRRIAILRALDVRIGVSLDGDQAAHDRHRLRRDNSGSYRQVATALRELMQPVNSGIFSGVLCTVDLANDPVATYDALLRFRPPMIDFLLPEGNWSAPPPGREAGSPSTPYADWLVAVFDRWYDAPEQETRIRFFTDIIDVLLDGHATAAGVSLAPLATIVVETDGTIEACDALTATQDGLAVTGLSVLDDPFDDVLLTPLLRERQAGRGALSETCLSCREVTVCGGGVHTQRFRAGSGFRNPSVYCPDLFSFITHIRRRLTHDIAALTPRGEAAR